MKKDAEENFEVKLFESWLRLGGKYLFYLAGMVAFASGLMEICKPIVQIGLIISAAGLAIYVDRHQKKAHSSRWLIASMGPILIVVGAAMVTIPGLLAWDYLAKTALIICALGLFLFALSACR